MPRKRFRPRGSRQAAGADVLLGQGKRVAEVVKALGVGEVTYRDEPLDREVLHSLREAQVLIEARRRHCNTVRPHSALGYRPPAPEAAPWPGSASAGPPRPTAGHGADVVHH